MLLTVSSPIPSIETNVNINNRLCADQFNTTAIILAIFARYQLILIWLWERSNRFLPIRSRRDKADSNSPTTITTGCRYYHGWGATCSPSSWRTLYWTTYTIYRHNHCYKTHTIMLNKNGPVHHNQRKSTQWHSGRRGTKTNGRDLSSCRTCAAPHLFLIFSLTFLLTADSHTRGRADRCSPLWSL